MPRGAFCTIADCSRRHYARGWCVTHYSRWLAHGDPEHLEGPAALPRYSAADLSDVTARVRTEAAWLTAVVLVGMANEAVANA